MLCDCSCDLESGNDLEFLTQPVARKQWMCCECGEAIEPGERYSLWSLCHDGGWSKMRTCLPCARIRDSVCDCWVFGELKETIWYCLGFDYVTGEYNPDWYPRSYHAEAV